jgi:hypothetical protein
MKLRLRLPIVLSVGIPLVGTLLVGTLLIGALLLLPVPGSAAAPDTEAPKAAPPARAVPERETWHALTFVSGEMGLRLIYYWSKGDWMRAETLIGGHPIVTIVRDHDYVSFDRLTGKGARIRRSPNATREDADRTRPFGNDHAELVAQGAVKVEESKRAGQDVEIWRITDSSGRRKLWLTRGEPQLPMRIENFVRANGETITTDYSDWVRGIEMPDSFFDAPSNVQLEEFEYRAYVEASGTRAIAPVLYPDLLHGVSPP